MQDSIRLCGKHFAFKNKQQVAWHQDTLASLRQVGNSTPLDDGEEETLAKCIQCLVDKDHTDASKARFLSRCNALKDIECVSKGFFKKLATKRQRDTLAKLHLDDSTIVQDGPSIATECTTYFGNILSKEPTISSLVQSTTSQTMFQYVYSCIDKVNVDRLYGPFDFWNYIMLCHNWVMIRPQVWMHYQKEFMIKFWDNISDLVLDVINEAWASQCLHPHMN